MRTRRRLLATTQAAALGTVAPFTSVDLAPAQTPGGTLRIGIAAASALLPKGQSNQGGEGQRFLGHTVFDRLAFWDLSRADAPSRFVPNLATAWQVDPAETTRFIFRIRPGVRFLDGGPFTAYAAQWNFEKILDQGAPHFDLRQSAQGRSRIATVARRPLSQTRSSRCTPARPTRVCPRHRLDRDVAPRAVGASGPISGRLPQRPLRHRAVPVHRLKRARTRRA